MSMFNKSVLTSQELPNTDLVEEVNLVIKEIPVEYSAVDEQVPQLWNEVKPKVTPEIFIIIRKDLFLTCRVLTSNLKYGEDW